MIRVITLYRVRSDIVGGGCLEFVIWIHIYSPFVYYTYKTRLSDAKTSKTSSSYISLYYYNVRRVKEKKFEIRNSSICQNDTRPTRNFSYEKRDKRNIFRRLQQRATGIPYYNYFNVTAWFGAWRTYAVGYDSFDRFWYSIKKKKKCEKWGRFSFFYITQI